MDLSARVLVLAGALASAGVEGCEKNEQYLSPGAQEEKKVDKAYNAEDISKRLSEVTEREFIDLYMDVSRNKPELLGLFYEQPWTIGHIGDGLVVIKDYKVLEIYLNSNYSPWPNRTEQERAAGKTIKVEMAFESRNDEKDGLKVFPYTRTFYIQTTKINGKRRIIEVGW